MKRVRYIAVPKTGSVSFCWNFFFVFFSWFSVFKCLLDQQHEKSVTIAYFFAKFKEKIGASTHANEKKAKNDEKIEQFTDCTSHFAAKYYCTTMKFQMKYVLQAVSVTPVLNMPQLSVFDAFQSCEKCGRNKNKEKIC